LRVGHASLGFGRAHANTHRDSEHSLVDLPDDPLPIGFGQLHELFLK
jgi:hypothetical protein